MAQMQFVNFQEVTMLKRNVWTYFLFAALALLWSATEIQAQDARGQIVGRLSDTTGAAIPNVQIKATNVATGITLTGTTNEEGMYEIPYLTIGIYSLRVQATGFKSYARDNLEVRVGDRLGVDITLEPGSVTETVTVTAESPLLETTNANLGDVVDERRITELPLSGGSPVTLMRFTTGLNDYSVPNHPSLAAGQDAVSNVGISFPSMACRTLLARSMPIRRPPTWFRNSKCKRRRMTRPTDTSLVAM
jgi:hypothetical protein